MVRINTNTLAISSVCGILVQILTGIQVLVLASISDEYEHAFSLIPV